MSMSDFDKLRNEGIEVRVGGEIAAVKEPKFRTTWDLIKSIVKLIDLRDGSAQSLWRQRSEMDVQEFGVLILQAAVENNQYDMVIHIIALILGKDEEWVNENLYLTDLPSIVEATLEVFHPSFFEECWEKLKKKFPKAQQKDGSGDSSRGSHSTN